MDRTQFCTMQVSILVLLEIALEVELKSRVFRGFFVSILVLLEIALEATLPTSFTRVECRFQSLFYWKLLWKNRRPIEK